MKPKIIFLADMESFYASVETARNPSLKGKPVAVCGDPAMRRGIVLAASKEAKAYGVKTGQPAWECRRLCPQIIFVRPRMAAYIQCSLRITQIFREFTDRVIPYSIDEQFLDLTGCGKLWGSPRETAEKMIRHIQNETGVRCRIGQGENPLQAKMACDRFAKKIPAGFYELNQANYAASTWPLPVADLFGVGRRMEQNLKRMGVRNIGHLAKLPRQALARRWGINGEVLWLNAHGIDYSTLKPGETVQKGVGHCATLPRDYCKQDEIEVVLRELTEEVCFRARTLGKMGATVNLYCRGADFQRPGGFSRQKKLPEPAATAEDVFPMVQLLFHRHWNRMPLRALGVALTGLVENRPLQLSFWNRREEKEALSRAADQIRERFGKVALFRASSLKAGSQLFQRASKIGGHES